MGVTSPRRQRSGHPGRDGIVVAEAAESSHQLGKARPSETTQPAVLETADHGLIDAAEVLELSLRESKPLASTKDEASDQLEPSSGLRIRAGCVEQVPRHRNMLGGSAYLAISCIRQRSGVPWLMYVDCITADSGAHVWIDSGDVSGRYQRRIDSGDLTRAYVRPGIQGLMQSSCINWGGSSPPRSPEPRHTAPAQCHPATAPGPDATTPSPALGTT